MRLPTSTTKGLSGESRRIKVGGGRSTNRPDASIFFDKESLPSQGPHCPFDADTLRIAIDHKHARALALNRDHSLFRFPAASGRRRVWHRLSALITKLGSLHVSVIKLARIILSVPG